MLHVLIAVCLLLLVTLGREAPDAGSAGSSAFQIPGVLFVAGREWLGILAVLAFGLGALCCYWVFHQSRLLPRWLSACGLVAIALVMVSALLVMFGLIDTFSTPQLVLALPIAVQEMVLAVWLIKKGFGPIPAPRGEFAPRPSRGASAAASA